MMYDEKVECYKRGAADPQAVQKALLHMEKFILCFNEAFYNNEPDDLSREIFRDLAEDYTFEFFRR